jgi:hypothetical protein
MIEAWEEEQMSNLGCESVGDLIAEVKRLHEWIYHHANNLDAGGVHRMGTPQPLSTFADEAREAIGVKRGEVHYLSSLLEEVKRLREGIGKVADNMAKLVEAYSSHLADEEVADWISGFTKDVLELIE